ncbi:hypothetical protein J5N97_016227 [Dioscorea zingiberensis]|uniref:Pectinesterase inhibitor domain-containing protein n=1 Tax=Dioscorea zingiberensis TaxID=325984 RepID=A0A9D5CKM7_9LILI|nr:hypothetical protein J5N97_016227 [Dioscorea zingiberensis]
MSDNVDQLKKLIREMRMMGHADKPQFKWHLGMVQIWVSVALTDQSTCMDGLAKDGKSSRVHAAIRKKVLCVAHVTSNSLALVNKMKPPRTS